MTDTVTLVEVGPRDGLQNEADILNVATKTSLLRKLIDCGIGVIEAGSFVSPKWVPQMADTDQLLASLDMNTGTRFPVLVPNLKGFEHAIKAGAREIAVFTAASESFSQRNTHCSIAESLRRLEPVIHQAKAAGMRVRGYISCVLGCPYQGTVPTAAVAAVCEQLVQSGCDEISLGDTIGTGTPAKAKSLIKSMSSIISVDRMAVHFHDTYGQALANILACLEEDIRIIDASVSGLGGCPYASGASGNVASEDVVYMLHGLGLETGIDLDKLALAGDWISKKLKRQNQSRAGSVLAGMVLKKSI